MWPQDRHRHPPVSSSRWYMARICASKDIHIERKIRVTGSHHLKRKKKIITSFIKGWSGGWPFYETFSYKIISFQMIASLCSLFGIIKIETPAGSLSGGCYVSFWCASSGSSSRGGHCNIEDRCKQPRCSGESRCVRRGSSGTRSCTRSPCNPSLSLRPTVASYLLSSHCDLATVGMSWESDNI